MFSRTDAHEVFGEGSLADLAIAAAEGDEAGVERSIRAGADPNAEGSDGVTPLLWAMAARNEKGCEALLRRGADPNHRSKKGRSAMVLAAGGDDPRWLRLLLAHRGDPALLDENDEPLPFTAVWQSRSENLTLLLDAGVPVDIAGKDGQTLSHRLAILNRFDEVLALAERGADFRKADVNGSTLTYWVRKARIAPGHPQERWRDRVREELEKRGATFPPPSPSGPAPGPRRTG